MSTSDDPLDGLAGADNGLTPEQTEMKERFEAKIEQQLTDLTGSIERLAARAQSDLNEKQKSRGAAQMPMPRRSFALSHMDTLPSDGNQPLAIFCEFENLVCSIDTEAVLLPSRPADRAARHAEYGKLELPLKEALAKLEAAGAKLAPGFEDFAELCSIRQVRLNILSHGLKPVIRHFLRQAGLGHVEVLANDLGVNPAGGWDVCFRDNSECGHDKGETLQHTLRELQLNARVVLVTSAADDFSVVETGLVKTLYARDESPIAQRCKRNGLRTRPFVSWEAMVGELQLL